MCVRVYIRNVHIYNALNMTLYVTYPDIVIVHHIFLDKGVL